MVITEETNDCKLFVPLRFWFNRHVGLSLPIIALQYHEVNINITFSSIYLTSSSSNHVWVDNTELWVNYIYLDTDERRRFAQVSHEYLIEQVQTQEFSISTATDNNFKLNFNHPVKELNWVFIGTGYEWGKAVAGSGSFGTQVMWNNNSKVQLKLNGHDRFAEQPAEYFTRYQPMKYHKNTGRGSLTDSIAVYSFALKPEEHQPSGTCNFSRIDSSQLELKQTNGSGFCVCICCQLQCP